MNALLPKAEFIKNEKLANEYQDLVQNPVFREAAKLALLTYATDLSRHDSSGPTLAVVGLKLQGAKEMLDVLMNFGIPYRTPTQTNNDELDPI